MRLNLITLSFFTLLSLLLSETLQAQTCISGRVYEDYNNNGVQDGPEPGLVGLTVNMVLSDGMTVSTSTNVSSCYFCNIVSANVKCVCSIAMVPIANVS